MQRMLVSCAALALIVVSASGQQAPKQAETMIRLSVYPMSAPKPALKYRLLPELKEMQPGNPIPNYLRCLMDQDFSSEKETFGRAALRLADQAARMDTPDWQILLKAKTDGFGLLLPDVQKMRSLATGLQGRFREEVALRHFDDGIVTAKTMFAMSRHMGQHPTIIGDLVGIAMAFVTIAPLEDMVQQPGCPNLYWALTNLPNPLISLESGLEGERLLIGAEFRDLDDNNVMTTDQLRMVIDHLDKLRQMEGLTRPKQSVRAWLNSRTSDQKRLAAVRHRLVESGISEERIGQFTPEQVILLDEKRKYEIQRDDRIKSLTLPAWQIDLSDHQPEPTLDQGLFFFFVPAVHKIRRAQGRLDQRIALLRHVEAIRMYAAEHDKLPVKLSDITVPLCPDPCTGKPFRYSVENGIAHLRGTPPTGAETDPTLNVHYEITLQK
jgi:hypothetical protein